MTFVSPAEAGSMHDARAVLDVRVLRRLGDRFGVQTWPVVLDLAHGVAVGDSAAGDTDQEVDAWLAAAGLIEHEEPTAWAATVLRVLSQPQREIEIRSYTDDGVRRICLARNAHDHVIARRLGDSVDVEVVHIADVDTLAASVRSFFDDEPACEFASISAPFDEVVDRLGRSAPGAETTDALHALGANPTDAVLVSSALASCRARTEIVASMNEDGRFLRSCGAVAVFDTDRGRLVSSPSKSPDGGVWITLSPGSGHRIAQAIRLLIEILPDGTWMP